MVVPNAEFGLRPPNEARRNFALLDDDANHPRNSDRSCRGLRLIRRGLCTIARVAGLDHAGGDKLIQRVKRV